jgi:hypothetical protein
MYAQCVGCGYYYDMETLDPKATCVHCLDKRKNMTLSQAMDVVFTVFPNAIVDERHGEIVILTGAKAVGLDEKLEPVEAGV